MKACCDSFKDYRFLVIPGRVEDANPNLDTLLSTKGEIPDQALRACPE